MQKVQQLKSFYNNGGVFQKVVDYILIVCLGLLLAINYQLFVVDNNFAPAGINGIATMIQYKFHFSIGYMSLLINVPLCIFAIFFINKSYSFKTLVFCLSYSGFYLLLGKMNIDCFKYRANNVDTIYPAIIAGLISGFVTGISYKINSSTGGTDVISKYVSVKKPRLNFFYVTFIINVVVAVLSYFVYAKNENGVVVYDYKPVCMCITYTFVSYFIGNGILSGYKTACKFIVITTHPQEINDEIIKTLKHTATQIVAMGAYSHKEKDVLICVVNKHQVVDFQNIIKKYDDTFAFIENVNEIVGNFKKIK